MFTTRTFSANIGDESVLSAGPDAIETDIDHLLANDALLIPKADIINNVETGGIEKVLSAEQGKVLNDRIDTIVYGNVVNDLTTGGVDVALSAEQGKTLKNAQYYGKVSQMSGGSAMTANGLIPFSTEDIDEFLAINLISSNTKITVPTGVTRIKLYWFGRIAWEVNGTSRYYSTVSIYKKWSTV